MQLDHYRTMGHSGLAVSPLCLGALTFGAAGGMGADAATAGAILDHFIDAGGNFIDTSNIYAQGRSEKILGEYFAARPSRRNRIVLATKFSAMPRAGDPNGGGANRKSVIAACEDSLRRLKTDHIDLYWLHWEDPVTPIEETMRVLDDLVRAGKVRYIGFSDTPAWKVTQAQMEARFRGWAPLIALQIEYSLIERTVEQEYLPMAKAMGLGITPWSPLGGGALTGKYARDGSASDNSARQAATAARLSDQGHATVDVLRELSAVTGATPAQIALAWVVARPGVTSPIVGVRTLDQLKSNLGAFDVRLDADQLAALDAASAPRPTFPAPLLSYVRGGSHGGLTINGQTFPATNYTPTGDDALG